LTHTETDQLRRSLERALDQQAATSDILRAMSGSPAEVQPVFDAIVRSGLRLLHGYSASMMLLREGESLDLVAYTSTSAEADASLVHVFPMPLRTLPPGERAVRDRRPHAVEDVAAAADVSDVMRETGPFAADEIALLETFAAQAVIAIENVRLFNELEAANRQLAAASRHKSEFLANMSHELRTPMNAILGFSEVLSEHMFGDLNEKQEEYLKDIHAAGQHLLSLINDILDLSKVEAGRMELELADFDLPTALGNTVMLVRERAGRRGITVETVLDGRLGEVRGDERKVRQVTLNLLSNAIKFTPEGGRIEVTAVPGEACVEVSVRDTGVGIAPEDQEKVFEEFRQVGTADKKVEGTGLGLALSRKFVELHGGRIWVTSEIGRGSTFTFTLPVPGAVSRPA
jgi:signal transduction histidine kinase